MEPMVWRQQYEKIRDNPYLPVAFFIGGFFVDIIFLDRIDGLLQFCQVVLYTLVLSCLVRFSVMENKKLWQPQGLALKYWEYNEFAIHFLLGSLLNLYSIFYFKSASIMTSIFFLAAIIALLLINEFLRVAKFQLLIIFILYYICMTSFWILFVPTVVGHVGYIPFILSLVATALSVWLFDASLPAPETPLRQFNLRVGGGVIIFFLLSYYLQLIPPVPLSINYMGVFHKVEKIDGKFILTHQKRDWKFWEVGDQEFTARPDDKIIAYTEIFAPRGFKDQVNARWLFKTNKGWQQQDLIPFTIVGGRDNGFRGYTSKANYQTGTYRIQLETTDAREIGRLEVDVIKTENSEPFNQYTIERN
jgi:Protein of unknown function (DUF2914)